MTKMNRIYNASNPHQGEYLKVLAVCSAGLLRSPTTAFVLSQEPFNCNTRAAGINPDFALVPVDEVLLTWAEQIVVMTQDHLEEISEMLANAGLSRQVISLDISDNYAYRDPELLALISERYTERSKKPTKTPKKGIKKT